MGFFGRLKNFISANSFEQKEIIERYKAEFRRYDDGHLRQICRTAVSAQASGGSGD